MANLIPAIGTRGRFVLLAPFDTRLIDGMSYTCMAVRRLQDVVAAGHDPFGEYYEANGLSSDQYQNDFVQNVCIVSLKATDGAWVYVPSSYIASYPDLNGVPYSTVALMISLSAIPDYLSLAYLKDRMVEVVKDNLGVTSEAQTLILSAPTLVSQSDHEILENARQLNIQTSNTLQAQVIALTAERDALAQKLQALESYIASGGKTL